MASAPSIPPPPPPIAMPDPDPVQQRIKAQQDVADVPGGSSRLSNNLGMTPQQIRNYQRAAARSGVTPPPGTIIRG
jgi:hypothetical protein